MAQAITITTQVPVDPEVSTPTYYQQLATEFMTAFEQMSAIIPKLEEAEATNVKVFRANLGVPDAFCNTAINAVEQLPELEAARKLHAEKSRNRLQLLEAFRPLGATAAGFSKRLDRVLMAAKSGLATDSLQIYRIAKSVASDKRSPIVEAHVAAMKRDLARPTVSKADREERKVAKLKKAVEDELTRRQIEEMLTQHGKEVKKAA
jgi:hypothetical protein